MKTGEIPFLKAHGVHPFEYLEKHPEDLKVFGESMTSLSRTENPAIAAAYKFSGLARSLMSVGGHGSLLATILKANPKLKGVLFDQASVIARRKERPIHYSEGCRRTLQGGVRGLFQGGCRRAAMHT
jgi:hypothetical protein